MFMLKPFTKEIQPDLVQAYYELVSKLNTGCPFGVYVFGAVFLMNEKKY